MKFLKIISGPLLGIFFGWLVFGASEDAKIGAMTFIVFWMATWWIFEVVPMAVTSMIPVFAFPLLGIMSTTATASVYMNDVLFLFVGGFMMSFAMEKWNLHHRIALHIILKVGTDGSKILLGLMLCSFGISMWISNTATVMMLIPTTLAIIYKLSEMNASGSEQISKALLLSIAHGATIGGVATIVGSPTNMIFVGYLQQHYAGEMSVSFMQWFIFALPLSLCMLAFGYYVLKRIFLSGNKSATIQVNKSVFEDELKSLGRMAYEEKAVLALFALMVLLWFSRADLPLGNFTIKGWSSWFKNPTFIQDGTVAVAVSMLLFLIPSKQKNEPLMNWDNVKKLPYSVILLFGGGFALAKGFSDSGLTGWLATQLEFLNHVPNVVLVIIVCSFITFISEFTSNMATIQLSLPVMKAIAISTGMNPLLMMIPGTVAASYAFMMPVGTAPNTIIFGSEKLKVSDMVKPGIWLNIGGIIIITIFTFSWGKWVFGI